MAIKALCAFVCVTSLTLPVSAFALGGGLAGNLAGRTHAPTVAAAQPGSLATVALVHAAAPRSNATIDKVAAPKMPGTAGIATPNSAS